MTYTPNKIPKTVVNAKGDLVIGTADDTVSRHGAGANGTVPVFDTAQGTGIENRFIAARSPFLIMQGTGTLTSAQTSLTRTFGTSGSVKTIGTDASDIVMAFLTNTAYAVTGWNLELLIVVNLITNNQDPLTDLTFTLRSINATGGGAGVITATYNAAASGSSFTITNGTITAAGQHNGNSGWFSSPGQDAYVIAVNNSATIDTNSKITMTAQLYGRYVN